MSRPAAELQTAYELHRALWAAEVEIWLATRELPGDPPPVEPREDLVAVVLQREAA